MCQFQDIVQLCEVSRLDHPVCFIQDKESQVLHVLCKFVVLVGFCQLITWRLDLSYPFENIPQPPRSGDEDINSSSQYPLLLLC